MTKIRKIHFEDKLNYYQADICCVELQYAYPCEVFVYI